MDEQSYLILDTRGGFKDLTRDVASISARGNLVEIVFQKSETVFRYARNHLFFSDKPTIIENDVAVNGHIVFDVEKKILFGKFLKLFYRNRQSELHCGDFKILKSCIPDTLAYFCDVARLVKNLPSENPEAPENTVVADILEKIQDVSTGTPLFSYLSGKAPEPAPGIENFIFPFQCNESQLKALEQTFANQLSLIQGPPGTGKTQTILNILMNAVIAGKKVAVVSNNNSAIQNVMDKLSAAEGLDFVAALLGNRENQNFFLTHQKEYPAWLKKETDCSHQDEQKLRTLHHELKSLFTAQNELKQKQAELNAWQIESEKFSQCYPDIPSLATTMTSEQLLMLFGKCNMRSVKHRSLPLWFKIWQVVFCRHWDFKFWKQPLASLLTILKHLYYQKKHCELQENIASLEKLLADAGFEKKYETLQQLSWKILKKKLRRNYPCTNSPRKKFNKYGFRKKDFFSEYPVVLSTTFMINNFAPEEGFDLLIMDEASQIDLCTGVAAIACAKNVVIAGDDKQLPCVVTPRDERKLAALNKESAIAPEYQYHAGQSILSSLRQAIPKIPDTTLCEHYRCDPLIIGFCNQKFYNGKLIIHSRKSNDFPLKVCFTVPGNHARGHLNLRQNQESQLIKKELIQSGKYTEDAIGLCTPYRAQAEKFGASTVHKFQGREKDVIIMSTVDNQVSSFTADERLVNVAVSRAREKFYLVISSSNRQWENCIGDLVNYIRYYGASENSCRVGHITSVFDKLYCEYRKCFSEASLRKLFFDSPAEEIIYKVLEEVLHEKDVDNRYAFQMHIPLREIFHANPQLSEDEISYLNHVNTHVDFLIYENYGKTPRFGIEVDGYTFHRPGTRQAKRDQLKNSIFAKNEIPLLRLSTNDSNEYERIKNLIFPGIANCPPERENA